MPRKKYKRKRAVEIHARINCLVRHGIRIKPFEIAKMIKAGHPSVYPVDKQSKTRTIYCVEVEGQKILVVYNNKADMVHTVLPKEDYRYKYIKGE